MDIFTDNALGNLLLSKASRTALDTLKLGETAIDGCNLWLLDPPATAGDAPVPAAIPAGFTKAIVCGRALEDVEAMTEAADPLFSMVVGAGDLVGADDTLHYESSLNLNVAALVTALEGQRTLQVLIDIDLENDDATARRRLVMQANGLVYRAVYRGTEGVPTSGSPSYPVPGALLTTGVDSATIKRGTITVANGAGSQAVVFTTPFALAPSTVQAWLMTPSGGAIIECAIDWSTIATTGFTAVFGALMPTGTYKLGWMALA